MRFLFIVLALISLPAAAQTALPHVALETDAGTITIRLEAEKAPATVANFLRYVDGKRLDGTSFYRAMLVGDPGKFGLVQGGVKGDPKRLLPPVKHEPTSQTGLSNTNGAISMARGAPGSATADFFIILGDLSSLDAKTEGAKTEGQGDIAGFAPFGQVVEGMDVVRTIQSAPTSPTLGEGAMKGQMLAKPITIKTARRVAYTPPEPAPKQDFDPAELPQP